MENGLSLTQVAEKSQQFGKNEIVTKSTTSAVSIFLSQFPTFINGILLLAATISFLVHDPIDGYFILAIVFINGIFGFFQEYRAEKSLEKLKTYTTTTTRVIREGKETEIPTEELVPDDIIVLREGDRIPADGALLTTRHLEIDESLLTGESLPVIKLENNEAFLGTLIVKGKGKMRVTQIGMQTRFGQIAESLATIEEDKAPLQKQLDTLGKAISLFAIAIALLLLPIGYAQGKDILPFLLLATSIAVAAIPEGLPAVITIALAIGTNRMAKRKTLIRRMPAVETLGAVQVILVDKTGTLTQNKMQVKKVWVVKKDDLPNLLLGCMLGNTASLIQQAEGKHFDIVGDKTDGALLLYAKQAEPGMEEQVKLGKIIDEHVFDTATRMITTVWEKDGKKYVFSRGAPEAILARSTAPQQERQALESLYQEYAKEGLRVIALAFKEDTDAHKKDRAELENDLHILGLIGIYDPPRPEVKHAIHEARAAGIKTIMVTGDNEYTALSIAKEIGLIQKDEDVVTGEELKRMSDDELSSLVLKTRVFARTEPHDKLRLATLLKKLGYVVGVTGDGVNDALALKKADVGIAMGESGTDVAKEASDIVIADDNFATLVKAVEEGRTVYSNIVKAITYLLSGNLSELSLVFFAALFGMPSVLLPTQILWINIVTDGLPALALASDNKNPDILKHTPRNPKIPILTTHRVLLIVTVGLGAASILLLIFQQLLHTHSEPHARTIIFNLLVFYHMVFAFFIRGQSIFRINKMLIITVFVTLLLQIIITTTPFFQEIFHLVY
ncbi:MAG: cation-translocating P-type ATPase [Candidatus Levybacteria bacterium]|nr:cation-translocating P-type ATPase [Candidatus Levybacteria bacterium]